jgi:hypothetical protein
MVDIAHGGLAPVVVSDSLLEVQCWRMDQRGGGHGKAVLDQPKLKVKYVGEQGT